MKFTWTVYAIEVRHYPEAASLIGLFAEEGACIDKLKEAAPGVAIPLAVVSFNRNGLVLLFRFPFRHDRTFVKDGRWETDADPAKTALRAMLKAHADFTETTPR